MLLIPIRPSGDISQSVSAKSCYPAPAVGKPTGETSVLAGSRVESMNGSDLANIRF
jgi:hypothetical protein